MHHVPPPPLLAPLLAASAALHHHLCPRQVLGVRIGLFGLRQLGLIDAAYSPRFENKQKRLLTIVETDGCGADGVSVATDCWVGRRTLRVEDYGKMAATLVDTATGRCIRVAPRSGSRRAAARCVPGADSRWHAYLAGYQQLPDEELLQSRPVRLTQSIAALISRPGVRAVCSRCGEEVMNEREIKIDDIVLCPHCAGGGYYDPIDGTS